MIKRKTFILLIGLVLFFDCSATKTLVCKCVTYSDEIKTKAEKLAFMRQIDEAQAIFSGEVIEMDFYKVEFKVDKVWKGRVANKFTMSTGTLKLENNGEMRSSCDYNFERGKSYLVFAQNLILPDK